MPDGRLLCINQTSHALMAAEFCHHWGNRDFACPQPYAAVMLGIAQHDNGWYEWEQRPHLRGDGYPMDFLHGPPGEEKIALVATGRRPLPGPASVCRPVNGAMPSASIRLSFTTSASGGAGSRHRFHRPAGEADRRAAYAVAGGCGLWPGAEGRTPIRQHAPGQVRRFRQLARHHRFSIRRRPSSIARSTAPRPMRISS